MRRAQDLMLRWCLAVVLCLAGLPLRANANAASAEPAPIKAKVCVCCAPKLAPKGCCAKPTTVVKAKADCACKIQPGQSEKSPVAELGTIPTPPSAVILNDLLVLADVPSPGPRSVPGIVGSDSSPPPNRVHVPDLGRAPPSMR